MMSYFINAAARIIEEEGIDGITIRKVADIAGYNSATLYNYFTNLDHLIFFAAMKFLKDYVSDLPKYVKDTENALERYLLIWECFSYHSFAKPQIYNAIFFTKLHDPFEECVKEYYQIFPQDLGDQPKELLPMLLNDNIYERALVILEPYVDEIHICKKDLYEVNEVVVLIYKGMLSRIINEDVDYSVEEAVNRTMKYIKQIIK